MWKLHDVGQRLLLADKKTEEDRTGGCLGAAPGEPERIDDAAVRGYFSELLRVHCTWEIFGSESLHDPRDFLCAPNHDGRARVSRKNRVIARLFRSARLRALRNLSNDRGKQRKGSTVKSCVEASRRILDAKYGC